LTEIDSLLKEQELETVLDVSNTRPIDMAYSAPNLKNLGYSLHKIAKDLLETEESGESNGF